jgi:hypothetical protein
VKLEEPTGAFRRFCRSPISLALRSDTAQSIEPAALHLRTL